MANDGRGWFRRRSRQSNPSTPDEMLPRPQLPPTAVESIDSSEAQSTVYSNPAVAELAETSMNETETIPAADGPVPDWSLDPTERYANLIDATYQHEPPVLNGYSVRAEGHRQAAQGIDWDAATAAALGDEPEVWPSGFDPLEQWRPDSASQFPQSGNPGAPEEGSAAALLGGGDESHGTEAVPNGVFAGSEMSPPRADVASSADDAAHAGTNPRLQVDARAMVSAGRDPATRAGDIELSARDADATAGMALDIDAPPTGLDSVHGSPLDGVGLPDAASVAAGPDASDWAIRHSSPSATDPERPPQHESSSTGTRSDVTDSSVDAGGATGHVVAVVAQTVGGLPDEPVVAPERTVPGGDPVPGSADADGVSRATALARTGSEPTGVPTATTAAHGDGGDVQGRALAREIGVGDRYSWESSREVLQSIATADVEGVIAEATVSPAAHPTTFGTEVPFIGVDSSNGVTVPPERERHESDLVDRVAVDAEDTATALRGARETGSQRFLGDDLRARTVSPDRTDASLDVSQNSDVSRETSVRFGGTPLADALADETRRRLALEREQLPFPHQTRVLTISNQKGGVGKTTTAVNLAAALARSGARVLVIDLDPQGNASTALGVDHRSDTESIYEVLVNDVPLASVVRATTEHERLFCVPATIHLAGAEIELVSLVAREQRLRRALDTYLSSVADPYHYVLIDCPPSLGLLTINAFVAAREVLIPIQCEYYALEGLSQLLSNIDLIQKHLNGDLRLSTILLTMYDSRTNLAQQVAQEVREHFPAQTLETIIPRSVRVSEAPSYGQSVISYDYGSTGSLSYREAAAEIARRGDATRGQ